MAARLPNRSVVIVGGGLAAALVSRQLTDKGIDVLVLERGEDLRDSAAAKLPSQRDELRWGVHNDLVQDWAVETYTLRHSRQEASLPIRRMEAFLPGKGMGGAANHWTGQTWRWSEYDPVLRTHLVVLTERPGDAASLVAHRDYAMAAPTPEHFLPVLYIAGAAAAAGTPAQTLVDGYAYGSLSMTSYGVGCDCPESEDTLGGAAPLSTAVPADDSNI